ncbi:type II toxin-antitoxin system VapC family toxin [Oerskovia sp. USHLN155]|uniref:type II toxin-antitoxin system VapC family toxin n=1 Tax=Oerskovia sp. USHLN155 TaxID=3081288 RepID=UPI003016C276
MTRFVIDPGTVLRLVADDAQVSDTHELLAPTLLRSQTLSALHEAVHRGDLSVEVGRERLARVGRLKIRLLGDGVLRRTAWTVAERLGWSSTYDAEYVALTQLQGDALVTADVELARAVRGVVETAPYESLLDAGA